MHETSTGYGGHGRNFTTDNTVCMPQLIFLLRFAHSFRLLPLFFSLPATLAAQLNTGGGGVQLWQHVLSFVDPESVVRYVSLVSHDFHAFATDHHLWRHFLVVEASDESGVTNLFEGDPSNDDDDRWRKTFFACRWLRSVRPHHHNSTTSYHSRTVCVVNSCMTTQHNVAQCCGHNAVLQEIKEEVLQLAQSFGWDEDGLRSTPTSSSSSPRHRSFLLSCFSHTPSSSSSSSSEVVVPVAAWSGEQAPPPAATALARKKKQVLSWSWH
jgi:hypothetical protein